MLWQSSIDLSMSMNMYHLLGEAFLILTWQVCGGPVSDSGLPTNSTGSLIPQVQVLQTGGGVHWETEIIPFLGAAIVLVLKIKEAAAFFVGVGKKFNQSWNFSAPYIEPDVFQTFP